MLGPKCQSLGGGGGTQRHILKVTRTADSGLQSLQARSWPAWKQWVTVGKSGEGWQAEQQARPSFTDLCHPLWDRSKPLLFCPAMNTASGEHPITEQQAGQPGRPSATSRSPVWPRSWSRGDQGGCPARLTAHSHSLISQPVVTSSSALPGKWKW